MSGLFEPFIDVDSNEEDRTLAAFVAIAGEVALTKGDVWVIGPKGKMLTMADTIIALNYAGAKCFVTGVANAVG